MAIHKEKELTKTEPKRSENSGKIAALQEYFDGSVVELKKVTWPTRKEVRATALAVLILVIVMSLFLGVVDLGLAKIVELILSPS